MNQSAPPTLTDEETRELSNIQKIKTFQKGDILIRENDIIKQYYFVINGCVRSYSLINNEEVTIDFFTENQAVLPAIIGENIPSPHFLVCAEDCTLSIVDNKMEQAVFERFPRLKQLCQKNTEQMLIQNQNEQIRFKSSNPEQRYEYFLNQRAQLLNRVPHHQIASYLGIKPESLSRLRKRLEQQKT
ncbi:MAG: Crp/Fnr family transcriptional regulator [Saccharospirillaceae bacterium]|nr:Crp/Fnr family transcriptional regulator [Pseudomonadales bacterium]NRB79724.1 Crp/Fnr family transcriptional regulator [Saccharospirillaceae bacterium]